jgi:hypothetical protein
LACHYHEDKQLGEEEAQQQLNESRRLIVVDRSSGVQGSTSSNERIAHHFNVEGSLM